MSTDASGTGGYGLSVPDEWDDVDPLVLPFMMQPSEWFQDPGNQYETVFGPFGAISRLTPDMVRFRAGIRRDQFPNIDNSQPGEGVLIDVMGDEVEADVRGVADREHAVVGDHGEAPIDAETAVVWINRGETILEIHEQVPFGEDTRVTTPGELRSTLNEIMDAKPEWGELFSVASDVVGTESVY